MRVEFNRLIQQYQHHGVLLDSNLLLLLLVGTLNPNLIGGKRTSRYLPAHFDKLSELLAKFKCIVTIPHILTEVSNLGGQELKDKKLEAFYVLLQHPTWLNIEVADIRIDERHVPRNETEVLLVRRFGLTDAVTIKLCLQQLLLLSDDFPLVGVIQKRGGHAINFNHLLYQ